jgi:hypothetical protein
MAQLPNVFHNGRGGYRDVDPDVLQYHTESGCPRVQQCPEIRNRYVDAPHEEGLKHCNFCQRVERDRTAKRGFHNQ